jgi:hypothetical protein
VLAVPVDDVDTPDPIASPVTVDSDDAAVIETAPAPARPPAGVAACRVVAVAETNDGPAPSASAGAVETVAAPDVVAVPDPPRAPPGTAVAVAVPEVVAVPPAPIAVLGTVACSVVAVPVTNGGPLPIAVLGDVDTFAAPDAVTFPDPPRALLGVLVVVVVPVLDVEPLPPSATLGNVGCRVVAAVAVIEPAPRTAQTRPWLRPWRPRGAPDLRLCRPTR